MNRNAPIILPVLGTLIWPDTGAAAEARALKFGHCHSSCYDAKAM